MELELEFSEQMQWLEIELAEQCNQKLAVLKHRISMVRGSACWIMSLMALL
jgi:hypothetical protein